MEIQSGDYRFQAGMRHGIPTTGTFISTVLVATFCPAMSISVVVRVDAPFSGVTTISTGNLPWPYEKNDQAQAEQKNWTHVRQLLG